MARRPFLAGNWKMHKTVAESVAMVRELRGLVSMVRDVQIAVAPPFTAIHAVAKALDGSAIEVAGQNCHWEPKGAFTGEIAASMVEEAGGRHVILGHSERRQYFGETDQTVKKRLASVLATKLSAIVCVGETLAERDAGRTLAVVDAQVRGALGGTPADQAGRITIAYEPVWAIGTGRNATPEQAQEIHAAIRTIVRELFGDKAAAEMRIQYGGSVKPENAADLMAMPDIDGALVGGASLTADGFARIVKFRRT